MADNDACYVFLAEACVERARDDYIEALKNLTAFEKDTPECLKRRQLAMNRINSAIRQELKRWTMPPTPEERREIVERRIAYYKITNERTIINVTSFITNGWVREIIWEKPETIIRSWTREVMEWAE